MFKTRLARYTLNVQVQVGDAFLLLLDDPKANESMLRVTTDPFRIEEVTLEIKVQRIIKQVPPVDTAYSSAV